ncbi:hypothetical protein VTN00DRAFT_965 [Thermoascus crustaceus]
MSFDQPFGDFLIIQPLGDYL